MPINHDFLALVIAAAAAAAAAMLLILLIGFILLLETRGQDDEGDAESTASGGCYERRATICSLLGVDLFFIGTIK